MCRVTGSLGLLTMKESCCLITGRTGGTASRSSRWTMFGTSVLHAGDISHPQPTVLMMQIFMNYCGSEMYNVLEEI